MANNPNKIYGMLLEIRDTFFLSIQFAVSLEEAVAQAKLEFIKLNPSFHDLLGLKVNLYTIKNPNTLVQEHKDYDSKRLPQEVSTKKELKKPVEIKKVEFNPAEVKNLIMKEIISKKDKEMLEKHKELFSENEIKYLTERLNRKESNLPLDK